VGALRNAEWPTDEETNNARCRSKHKRIDETGTTIKDGNMPHPLSAKMICPPEILMAVTSSIQTSIWLFSAEMPNFSSKRKMSAAVQGP
jgi:hypothetical protein